MLTVHPHAYKRAIERYGIMPKKANRWANEKLGESTFIETQEDGRHCYAHPTEDIFVVLSPQKDMIITVIDKTVDNISVKSPFLDAILAPIEREYEKMKKSFRSQLRELEMEYATAIVTKGKILQKRARVYNPNTQAILEAQASEMDTYVAEKKTAMAELRRDYEAASLKVRGFLRTAAGEPR